MSFEWQAGSWLRWARTPGHDSYWHFREAFPDASPTLAAATWQRLPNFLHLRAVKPA
jgi:hypothetical protein